MRSTPYKKFANHTSEPLDLFVLEGGLFPQASQNRSLLVLDGTFLCGSIMKLDVRTRIGRRPAGACSTRWSRAILQGSQRQPPSGVPRKRNQFVDVELEEILHVPASH